MSESLKKKDENSLRSLVESESFKEQVAKALPKHLTPDRFIRISCTALMRTPKLMECEQVSFFNALLSLSQLGLEPDGRRAHLIPFNNTKRGVVECQLIVDYKGLVELAMRAGNVANIHADVVCDNDDFVYDRGQITRHAINFKKPRGAVYAAYATVRFKDGTEKTEVMSKDEIEAIKGRSKAGNFGPWQTDWNEMAKKTVFRRLSKWITLSPEYHAILEKDFDSFESINQVSAKALIPPPPLKPQAEQKFEDVVTFTEEKENEQEPEGEDKEPGDRESETEPQGDDNSLDGLKKKIRSDAAKFFPNENSFALWLKTTTRNEEKNLSGFDNVNYIKSAPQARFILATLRKKIAESKENA